MKKNDPNYTYEITETLGVASPQADLTSNWAKCVLKTLMNHTKEGIDIRNMDMSNKIMRSGIRLSMDEANNVVDILLENGYGSMEAIEKAYNKRKNLFEDIPNDGK